MSMVHRKLSDASVSIWQSSLHNTILSFTVERSLCCSEGLDVNPMLGFLQPRQHLSIFQSTDEGTPESPPPHTPEKERLERLKNICLRKHTLLWSLPTKSMMRRKVSVLSNQKLYFSTEADHRSRPWTNLQIHHEGQRLTSLLPCVKRVRSIGKIGNVKCFMVLSNQPQSTIQCKNTTMFTVKNTHLFVYRGLCLPQAIAFSKCTGE